MCGATYSPTELIEPKSVVSGATPVMRDSEHFFFDLPSFSEMLQAWTRSGALQEQVANKMQEWFESGLQQWDISRDAPYFGFEIPNAPGKYFYVWLERANRLHGLLQEPVRQAWRHRQLRRILEERFHGRAVSLYR